MNTDRIMTANESLPHHIAEAAEAHGIDHFSSHAAADLSTDGVRCEEYIFVSGNTVSVLSGVTSFAKPKHFPLWRRRKLKKEFKVISFAQFALADYKSFEVKELISSALLAGEHKDGTFTVIAASTNSEKQELFRICGELHGIVEGDDPERDHAEHGKHDGSFGKHGGFGGPGGPGGGPGGPGGHNSTICPKCGKKYTDPGRKICMNCMDRGKIIRRTMSFVMKYKGKITASVLILIVTGALSIITPYASSGFYYDQVLDAAGAFYGQLILVLALIVSTKILSTGVTVLSNIVSSRLAASLEFDLSTTIFSSVERLSLDYFSDRQTGALMTQVSGDANTIYRFFLNTIPYFLVNSVQILAIAVIMFIMNPTLAALFLATTPLIILFMRHMFLSMGKYHRKRWSRKKAMNAFLSDTLNGVRVVKAFSRESAGSEKFRNVNDAEAKANRAASLFGNLNFPIVDILTAISQLAVLGVGGWMVINGTMKYGILMTFISYMAMVTSPLVQFVRMSYDATDSLTAMSRLIEVMDAEPTVQEAEEPVKIPGGVFDGRIEFRDVSFGYVKNRNVLKNITFTAEAGTTLGIVGHTGAGKSTIANLMTRMYDAGSGEILIDGIPIKELPVSDLRRNIAIVSQETYLFAGTILDNIRYARPEATEDEVIRAAKISGAHDFIIKLPDAYSTKIGFGEHDLSGGEKQRVSIARALLRDPKVLILDEATAAMDTQTERKIQSALEVLAQGKTTVMIAHRLSTLRMADKLIVLKDGESCEAGTHENLIRQRGEYFKLYSLQLAALKSIGVEE